MVGCGSSDRSWPFVRRTVLGCRRYKVSIVGPTFFKFLLIRRRGCRAATERIPSLPKSSFLPSANALFMDARTASTARFASAGFTPVFWTIADTIDFLVVFGIVISSVLLVGG